MSRDPPIPRWNAGSTTVTLQNLLHITYHRKFTRTKTKMCTGRVMHERIKCYQWWWWWWWQPRPQLWSSSATTKTQSLNTAFLLLVKNMFSNSIWLHNTLILKAVQCAILTQNNIFVGRKIETYSSVTAVSSMHGCKTQRPLKQCSNCHVKISVLLFFLN